MKKPNILLITTDTQRWDTLKCMGSEFAHSPFLDKLAAEGVLFEQAHTSSPVCMPARCCLLTGTHTPIHECIENGMDRRNDLMVFPDLLEKAGYKNIMVGKTHYGKIPDSFHVQKVIKGEKGKDADDFYGEHIRSHGYSRSSKNPNLIPEEIFMDAFLADTTIREIDKVVSQGDQPFFAFCSMLSPHAPLDPPGKWKDMFSDYDFPINYTPGEEKHLPGQIQNLLNVNSEYTKGKLDREKIQEKKRLYYGLAAYCDFQIGRIIKFLDERGLRENTLVIFTSDHGQQFGDHGFDDKHNYYDESLRVPMIMSMPGSIPLGEKRDFIIWNDITATILAAAGTEYYSVQGFDYFTPLCRGEKSPRNHAVSTLYKSTALVTDRWKLEYYFEEGTGRLFDRKNDSRERNDLFNKVEFLDIRNQLVNALLSWRGDQNNLQFLREGLHKGGPVAQRVNGFIKNMKGIDSEVRLNRKVENLTY